MPVTFKREFPWLESLVLTISFPEKLVALLLDSPSASDFESVVWNAKVVW